MRYALITARPHQSKEFLVVVQPGDLREVNRTFKELTGPKKGDGYAELHLVEVDSSSVAKRKQFQPGEAVKDSTGTQPAVATPAPEPIVAGASTPEAPADGGGEEPGAEPAPAEASDAESGPAADLLNPAPSAKPTKSRR